MEKDCISEFNGNSTVTNDTFLIKITTKSPQNICINASNAVDTYNRRIVKPPRMN